MKTLKILKLFFLCLVLLLSVSVGYSKLEQELSINSTATIEPEQTDYSINYTLNKWKERTYWHYQYTVTITYLGNDSGVTSWDLTLAVPLGTIPVLGSNCQYSYTSGTLKIYNISYNGSDVNGTIAPNGTAVFMIDFKTSDSNYSLNVTNANFYSANNPNPNLTPILGTFTIRKSSDYLDSSDGKLVRQYSLTLNNPTNYSFQTFECIINGFNTNLVTLFSNNFSGFSKFHLNYVIKSSLLILDGNNLGSNHNISLSFAVKYLTSNIIDLNVLSFIGKALILS